MTKTVLALSVWLCTCSAACSGCLMWTHGSDKMCAVLQTRRAWLKSDLLYIGNTIDDGTCATAGKGAQVVAWEADLLNDLYQVRQLKAKVSQAVHKVNLAILAIVFFF